MRRYPDFIAACAAGIPGKYVPRSFRTWAPLVVVGAALKRRIWYNHGDWKCYPNLYVVMVANPGGGKGIAYGLPVDSVFKSITEPLVKNKHELADAKMVWSRYLKDDWMIPCHMMSGNITYEDLCQGMSRVGSVVEGAGVPAYPDTSILIRNSEFGVFMKRNDKNLQMLLTEGWDSYNSHEYLTKNKGEDIIHGPTISWLAGATPSEFIDNLPINASEQGILSRIIPVVELQKTAPMEIRTENYDPDLINDLAYDLAEIAQMKGEFNWSAEAEHDLVVPWLAQGQEPKPTEPQLEGYNSRRFSHLLKITMCFSAARRNTKVMEAQDWVDALKLLLDAEVKMPILIRRFGMSEAGRTADTLVDLVGVKKRLSIRVLKRLAMRTSKNINDVEKTIDLLIESGALIREGDLITVGTGL